MNAPAKIRLHGVSLPFAPIAASDPAPRKTPLEAYQESRIPKPGAFDRVSVPTAIQRAAIESGILLAALTEPRSAGQIAEGIGEDVTRVAKALSLLERRGEVCQIKKSSCASLWCKPGTRWEGKTVKRSIKHMTRDDYRAEALAKVEARYARILALIEAGRCMTHMLYGKVDRSNAGVEADLATLRKLGRIRSTRRVIDGKLRAIYEVAQ